MRAKSVLVFFLVFSMAVLAARQTVTTRPVATLRGNAIMVVRIDGVYRSVFLAGVQLPWPKQSMRGLAKNWLSDVLRKSVNVRLELSDPDIYGHVFAQVYAGDCWINKEIIGAGLAWCDPQSRSSVLKKAQSEAQKKKIGIWMRDDAQAPWDFRAEVRRQTDIYVRGDKIEVQKHDSGHVQVVHKVIREHYPTLSQVYFEPVFGGYILSDVRNPIVVYDLHTNDFRRPTHEFSISGRQYALNTVEHTALAIGKADATRVLAFCDQQPDIAKRLHGGPVAVPAKSVKTAILDMLEWKLSGMIPTPKLAPHIPIVIHPDTSGLDKLTRRTPRAKMATGKWQRVGWLNMRGNAPGTVLGIVSEKQKGSYLTPSLQVDRKGIILATENFKLEGVQYPGGDMDIAIRFYYKRVHPRDMLVHKYLAQRGIKGQHLYGQERRTNRGVYDRVRLSGNGYCLIDLDFIKNKKLADHNWHCIEYISRAGDETPTVLIDGEAHPDTGINVMRSKHIDKYREGPLSLEVDLIASRYPLLFYRIEAITGSRKRIPTDAAEALTSEDPAIRATAAHRILRSGDEGVGELMAMLQSGDTAKQQIAAKLLAKVEPPPRDPKMSLILVKLLGHKDGMVRLRAFKVLERIKPGPEVLTPIAKASQGNNLVFKMDTAKVLGLYNTVKLDEKNLASLCTIIRTDHSGLQRAALALLIRSKPSAEAVPVMVPLLSEKNARHDIREKLLGLPCWKDAARVGPAIAPLVASLNTWDRDLRKLAFEQLQRWPPGIEGLPALAEVAKNDQNPGYAKIVILLPAAIKQADNSPTSIEALKLIVKRCKDDDLKKQARTRLEALGVKP